MKSSMIGKRIFLMLLSGFLLLGLMALFFFYGLSRSPEHLAPSAIVVDVRPIIKRTVPKTLEATGTARAYESVTISANVTEYVKTLHFEDGEEVKKGRLLVELNAAEEQALLAEAQARLHEADLHYERLKKLLKQNFSAQSEYDAQKANLESAKAKLDQIQTMIDERNIKAPFDGILGFRQVSEGALVEPGDQIVTLDMIQPIRIDFTVSEQYLSQIQVGELFKATSVAFPGEVFEGKIATILVRIDEQTRAASIRGLIPNEHLKLKPGMLLNVTLTLASEDVMTIPEEALLAEEDQRYVFVLQPGETKVKRHPVVLVGRRGGLVDIKNGLDPKSMVVTQGAFKLKDGQEVMVQHAD